MQLWSVLLQLPHPNGSVLGWRGCTLQGMKMTSWVYFASSYFRTPEKTQLKKSTNIQQMKHGRHVEMLIECVRRCKPMLFEKSSDLLFGSQLPTHKICAIQT